MFAGYSPSPYGLGSSYDRDLSLKFLHMNEITICLHWSLNLVKLLSSQGVTSILLNTFHNQTTRMCSYTKNKNHNITIIHIFLL